MSSGVPTNGTATADLCPLDGRRSSTEMWTKLFVVHFTTISFFCHLLSIRKEPIFTPKLILYILNPLVLLLHYGLALCAIILAQCFCSSVRYQDPVQALRWLFGTIARETGPDYDLISSLPRASRTESQLRRKRRDKLWKRIGRIAVTLAFLAQCIGAIFLYQRRQRKNAAAITDRIVFELACSGILTSLLALLFLAKVPIFSSPVPDIPEDQKTTLDRVVLYLRYTWKSSLVALTSPDGGNAIQPFLLSGTLSFAILEVFGKLNTGDAFFKTLGVVFHLENLDSTEISSLWVEELALGLGLFLSIASFGLMVYARIEDGEISDACPMIFSYICISWFIFLILFIITLGFLWVFLWWCRQLHEVQAEIQTLAAWPTTLPCPPQLWSDPLASWVWMLA